MCLRLAACRTCFISQNKFDRLLETVDTQDTLVPGKFLRDLDRLNQDQRNFRIFGPDETLSNLLGAAFEATNRQWDAREVNNDEFLAPAGGVLDSMLGEHQCEG